MDRFEAMRALVAAVDGGSLSAASRTLGVPLPTISRRVSDLEAHLRVQLVVRTSRRLMLTEPGQAFVATSRRILEDLDEAERAAIGEYRAPRGELLITAPVMFGRLHVEPVVLEFLAAYPEINVRLILADHMVDVIESHTDLAVRIGSLPDSGLVAKRLGAVAWTLCASPDYLARRGMPQAFSDLTAHDCLGFERLNTSNLWTFRDGKDEIAIPVRPRFAVSTASGVIDAALAGAGIARVLSYQVAQEFSEGRLEEVLGTFRPEPLPVHLVYAGHAILPQKLRAFIDYAAPRLRVRLESP